MYHINNDKRSINSSELIYNALHDLIKVKSYEKITITDIVAKAQVGRSTFYRNFDTKDDILIFECEKKLKILGSSMQELLKKDIEISEHFMISYFLKFWYLDSTIIELFIETNNIHLLLDTFVSTSTKLFSNLNLTEHIDSEYIDYFFPMRAASLLSLLVQWIKNNKKHDPDKLAIIIQSGFIKKIRNNIK